MSSLGTGERATWPPQRLLLDVTRTVDSGLHTGIQRVVRGLYRGAQSISTQPAAPSVHAVRCEGTRWLDMGELAPHPLEGRQQASAQLRQIRNPELLQARPGDTLLLADASWYVNPWPAADALLDAGGEIAGFVHDLLPLLRPDWFRPGTSALFEEHFHALLGSARQLFVSSEHVAGQLRAYQNVALPVHVLPLASSLGTLGSESPAVPGSNEAPFFLCVATLEPRKNHALILDAFDCLWHAGDTAQLMLVGGEGWCNDAVLKRIREHPEIGRRLQWLSDINDAQLVSLYQRAAALIYVPDDEGFGIPVLEARQLGCPVIASDIAPLREAGGTWPRYLPPNDVDALIAAVRDTLRAARPSAKYTVRQWQDVAGGMLDVLTEHSDAPLAMTGTDA